MNETQTHSSIRIGIGRDNTYSEILFCIGKIISSVRHINNLTL